jgi:hypothetical protein
LLIDLAAACGKMCSSKPWGSDEHMMTTDDLLVEDPHGGDIWGPSRVVNTALLTTLISSPDPRWPDVEAAIVLCEQVSDDLRTVATSGHCVFNDVEISVAIRAVKATVSRVGLTLEVPFRDYQTFKRHWERKGATGSGSWALRRQMVDDIFEATLSRLYDIRDKGPAAVLVAPALNALTSVDAIHEHLQRLNRNLDADPRLAVSVAKDLLESTAKLVLVERGVAYTASDDLPKLAFKAQDALGLHASRVTASSTEGKSLKQILGALSSLIQGVAELRNDVGVGHGRESVPTWVRPRHARLAAGAAGTWCNLMLETLGDPDAPWRVVGSGGTI